MTLSFCGEIQLGATIEFVALATKGTVVKNKVVSPAATYLVEENPSERAFTLMVKNSKQRSTEEFNAEVIHVFCALRLMGAKTILESGFGKSKNFPPTEILTWLRAPSTAALSHELPIDERTNLTVNDLVDIWRLLVQTEQPVEVLLNNTEFIEIFPYADLVAGEYEKLRHKSGCEVSLQTRKNGTISEHRIDAPNPVSNLVTRLRESSGQSLVSATLEKKPSIFHKDGYWGGDESRWRISKMLGAVPPQHKSAVFAWAADAINKMDEFHNTRGGVQLPTIFECRFDDVHLTADRDLKFEFNQG